jgi:predicted ribosomally synthesized peptide with SipW-like signal peptide
MPSLAKKLAITVVALVALVAVTATGTLARLSDQDTHAANTFNAGTVALATNPTTALMSLSNMMIGSEVTAPLVVTNSGTGSLRYAVSSVATNADAKGLKDQLVLTVRQIDYTYPATPCDNFDGTQLYSGDLDAAAGKILGDTASGQNGLAAAGGDRTLAGGANETLCFRVSLAYNTPTSFQSATTTATFTLDSEQTSNNP